ncbi:MAG: hypothetical protein JWL98_1461 [Xanthomonadaceae bacterium]|nr:hypothetical protein [Xanthomonadaceae bacterium]
MSQAAVLPLDRTTSPSRSAGVAIAAATVVSTIFVALDHGGGGSNALEVLQGIARLQVLKEVVHGVAIASVCAYAFGYATLGRRLGLQRPLVLAGLAVYLMGCVAMIGATILDGFVTPHVAMDAITGSPEKIKFAYALIYYIGIVLNDLAKLGWILQAVGALAWSITLIGNRGLHRVIGIVGLFSSLLVCVLIAAAATNMTMTSLLGVLLAQLIWNLAAAVLLVGTVDSPTVS